MPTLEVVGFDPSLNNWGAVRGFLDLGTQEITIKSWELIQPHKMEGKQVRQNSIDLDRAHQLALHAANFIGDARAIFVEVPVGSKSARAMASYGICIGVLGGLRARGVAFTEVTPTQVKLAGAGDKTASKDQMIEWVRSRHPNVDWPRAKAKAEHVADAAAAVHAGVALPEFQNLIQLLK